ncbi:MAG TPA: hypothetical protein VIK18_10300, partial [Pirellulales bacterium]
MTRRIRFGCGWVLACVLLAASPAAPLSAGDPPPAAARQAEFQERERLWQEAHRLRTAGKTAEAIAAG